jgi:hypothetical protein
VRHKSCPVDSPVVLSMWRAASQSFPPIRQYFEKIFHVINIFNSNFYRCIQIQKNKKGMAF